MKTTCSFLFFVLLTSFGLAGSDQDAARKIDQILAKHWKAKSIEAAPIVSDEVFLRRSYLDIIGRIPSGEETKAFLDDKSKSQREALIDSLLESEGYINHQFNYWADILRIHTQQGGGQQVVPSYIAFVKKAIRARLLAR